MERRRDRRACVAIRSRARRPVIRLTLGLHQLVGKGQRLELRADAQSGPLPSTTPGVLGEGVKHRGRQPSQALLVR